jgi:hypothetical protein
MSRDPPKSINATHTLTTQTVLGRLNSLDSDDESTNDGLLVSNGMSESNGMGLNDDESNENERRGTLHGESNEIQRTTLHDLERLECERCSTIIGDFIPCMKCGFSYCLKCKNVLKSKNHCYDGLPHHYGAPLSLNLPSGLYL